MKFTIVSNAHLPGFLRDAIYQLLNLLRIIGHAIITFALPDTSQRPSEPQLLEFARQLEQIFGFFDL